MDGAGSYSVAHRAGLLPTELTGMRGWILLRSAHQGRGSTPVPASPIGGTPRIHPWAELQGGGGGPGGAAHGMAGFQKKREARARA